MEACIVIVCGDLDSAELRICVYLAKDSPFQKLFDAQQKPHFATAQALFGKLCGKDTEEYTFAKSYTYASLYTLPGKNPSGASGLRLYSVPITDEAMARFGKIWDREHPALKADKMRAIAELERTGKVYNLFGRFRDLSWGLKTWDQGLREHVMQAALNFRCQTVVGKILNRAFLRLDAWCDMMRAEQNMQGWPCIQNHDEIVFYTPVESEVPVIGKAIKDAIETPVPELGNMVIPADLSYGKSWGELHSLIV